MPGFTSWTKHMELVWKLLLSLAVKWLRTGPGRRHRICSDTEYKVTFKVFLSHNIKETSTGNSEHTKSKAQCIMCYNLKARYTQLVLKVALSSLRSNLDFDDTVNQSKKQCMLTSAQEEIWGTWQSSPSFVPYSWKLICTSRLFAWLHFSFKRSGLN